MPSSASHNGRDKIGIDYIGYADDLILTFGKSTDLRRALKLLDEVFASCSLAINKTKTKTIILNIVHKNFEKNDDKKRIQTKTKLVKLRCY